MTNVGSEYYTYTSPIGDLGLFAGNGLLIRISFAPPELPSSPGLILSRVVQQLDQYFAGATAGFQLPLAAASSHFLNKVYEQLGKVMVGETVSYAELASRSGSPGGARAVGQAMARNPFPVVVPCHRVLAVSGIGGYAGGLSRKRWLLAHEKSMAERSV